MGYLVSILLEFFVAVKSQCCHPFHSRYFTLQTFPVMDWSIGSGMFVKRLIEVDNGSNLLTAADYEYK